MKRPLVLARTALGILAFVAPSVASPAPPEPGEGRRLMFDDVGVLQAVNLTLAANTEYRIWTQETGSGGDPVVHLWVRNTQSPFDWGHGGSNDDHESPTGTCSTVPAPSVMSEFDACLEYENTASATQPATLLLRAYRRSYSGTTRLRVENLDTSTVVYDQALSFSGQTLDQFDDDTDVAWDAYDRLDVAYIATGMLFPQMLVLRGSEDLVGTASTNASGSTWGGLWGQPRLTLLSASGTSAPGKGGHSIMLGNAFSSLGYGDGSALVYRNDRALGDSDGDGLGDDLEDFLGTDPEAEDSDQDGFRDGLEVVGGAHHPECTGSQADQGPTTTDPTLGCAINLGTFGADPLVRDVFVTFIWMAQNPDTTPVGSSLAAELPKVAEVFASSTGHFGTVKPQLNFLYDYGQEELGPFAAGGPRLPHQQPFCMWESAFDDCEPVSSCTIPADCGTNYTCLAGQCIYTLCGEYCNIYDASNPHPTNGDPHSPWNLERVYWGDEPLFPINRRGLSIPFVTFYKWTNSQGCLGCGQCRDLRESYAQLEAPSTTRTVYPGLIFSGRMRPDASFIMHEVGHALRLAHAPADPFRNRQPNHLSVMNYSFQGLMLPTEGSGTEPFLDFGSDLDSDEEPRPSLRWLGEEVPDVTAESECCCFEGGCLAEPSDDFVPGACCPTCGQYNSEFESCVMCPALWDEGTSTCSLVVSHDPYTVEPSALTEAECCCDGQECEVELDLTPQDWCASHLGAQASGNNTTCHACNAHWYQGECYYGGLDDRVGVGANKDEDQHPTFVSRIAQCVEPGPTVDKANSGPNPYNIDWNGSGAVSASTAPRNLSARNPYHHAPSQGCTFGAVPSPFESVEAIDEWALVADWLAGVDNQGTQGLGLPAFCDNTFGCASGETCVAGWCQDEELDPPVVCVPGASSSSCELEEEEE